jgi:hypothetical protein
MPINDWTRVFDGAFHAFHHVWIAEIQKALNTGILPPDYYALAEQVVRPTVPDVLTLQLTNGFDNNGSSGEPVAGAVAVATAPPHVRLHQRFEADPFTRRQRSVVVRHGSDDRIIAVIEILSAGNKVSNKEFQAFVSKAVDFLDRGYHLLLIDLHPRTTRDPEGIHPIMCAEVGELSLPIPPDKPLTLAAYDAGPPVAAYVEPVAVGDVLIDMPLFLAPGWYVSAPLEATYQAAYRGVPRRFREVLDAPASDH